MPRVLTINPPDEVLMKLADGGPMRTFSEPEEWQPSGATIRLKKIGALVFRENHDLALTVNNVTS